MTKPRRILVHFNGGPRDDITEYVDVYNEENVDTVNVMDITIDLLNPGIGTPLRIGTYKANQDKDVLQVYWEGWQN